MIARTNVDKSEVTEVVAPVETQSARRARLFNELCASEFSNDHVSMLRSHFQACDELTQQRALIRRTLSSDAKTWTYDVYGYVATCVKQENNQWKFSGFTMRAYDANGVESKTSYGVATDAHFEEARATRNGFAGFRIGLLKVLSERETINSGASNAAQQVASANAEKAQAQAQAQQANAQATQALAQAQALSEQLASMQAQLDALKSSKSA